MKISRGDVVYLHKDVNCPNPIRPFVIVSNNIGNKYAEICLGVPLTLKPRREQPTHCRISYNDSIAMTEQICVIQKEDIKKVLFSVSDEDMKKIEECLAISLDLGCDECV